jgi:hypothetical protein
VEQGDPDNPELRMEVPLRPSREILVVAIFVLFTSLSFFLIQYDRMRTQGPALDAWVGGVVHGIVPAPIQYRIALPFLLRSIQMHTHISVRQSLPFIESVAYLLALSLMYAIFRSSPRVEEARPAQRFVMLGLFLAATQFPILWIFPWDRPETQPTALYLAALVLLVAGRSKTGFGPACLWAVALSLTQALLRADVPIIAGVAVVLAAAISTPSPRTRLQMAALGLLCVLAGGATQLYLQRVAYPAAAYPADTPRFQLLTNLNPIHPPFHIPIFLTALLPLAFSVILIRVHRLPIEPVDKLVLLVCGLYLPVWVVTGLVVEVRIYVPFLFLASPTIAKVWGAYLLGDGGGSRVL